MAGVLAVPTALLPRFGLGSCNVTGMLLARKTGTPALHFGNAMKVALVAGTVFIALAALKGPQFLRDSSYLSLILLLGMSEMLATTFIDIAAWPTQVGRQGRVAPVAYQEVGRSTVFVWDAEGGRSAGMARTLVASAPWSLAPEPLNPHRLPTEGWHARSRRLAARMAGRFERRAVVVARLAHASHARGSFA
jgi:hypothetical protein